MKTFIKNIGSQPVKITLHNGDSDIDYMDEESISYGLTEGYQMVELLNEDGSVKGSWEVLLMDNIKDLCQHPTFISFTETFGLMMTSGYYEKIANQLQVGSIGAIGIITQWAVEFDSLNAGREWDGEFIEEVEVFTTNKFKSL